MWWRLLNILATITAASAALASSSCELRLRGGRFKILHLSDLEYTNGADTPCIDPPGSSMFGWLRDVCDETRTTKFIAALLRTEEPDLVVITGDSIIAGAVDPLVSLTQLLEPIVSYGKPWAVVFGNHDEESGVTRTEMLRHLHSLDSENGCTINGPVHLPGVGNYNLTVLGDDGAPILSLLMLDSGNGRNRYGGYDWINIQWFQGVDDGVQAWRAQGNSDAEQVPMLMFFHIPVPEFRSLLEEEYEKRITGSFREKVWHSGVNGGLYAAALERPSVVGMFVGHDHVNDFCYRDLLSGIYLCYAGSAGYGAYSRPGFHRRARVIELTAGSREISTWKRLDDGSLSVIDRETMIPRSLLIADTSTLPGNIWWHIPPHVLRIVLPIAGFVLGVLASLLALTMLAILVPPSTSISYFNMHITRRGLDRKIL